MKRSDLNAQLLNHYPWLGSVAAKDVVDEILHAIAAAISQGHRVEIRGFGAFTVRRRNARNARNPRTGAFVRTPEKLVLHFKPHPTLLKRLEAKPPNPGMEEGEDRRQ